MTDLIRWWREWPHDDGRVLIVTFAPDKKGASVSRCFDHPEQEDEFVKWVQERNATRNCYFAVNPTQERMQKKPTRDDVAAMTWLFVDCDQRAGEDPTQERKRILSTLQNAVPAPTAIIDSGNGYQAFWRLSNRVPNDPLYNLKLELDLGGDCCHNVDRILRLPDTVNRKPGKPEKRAALTELNIDRIYDIGQFQKAPPPSNGDGHKAQVNANNVHRIDDVNALGDKVSDLCKVVIVQGTDPEQPDRFPSRSEALFFVCCEMVRGGCDDQTIHDVITDPGFGISASVLDKGRSAESYAKRQIERARVDSASPQWVRELNREHAIIKSYGGRTRIIYEKPDGSLETMLRDDFKSFYEYERVEVGKDAKGNTKYGPMGHAWFTHEAARRYDYVAFVPREDAPDNVYNLFRGWSVTPKEGDCELFLDFVHNIICDWDESYFTYLMDWAAHLFQKPEEPGQVAVVLRGKQGIGKGYFTKTLGSLMGNHFAHVKNVRHLLGNFNAHLRNKLLVFGDEVFGTNEQSARGVLKAMITEETQDIEQKGVDVVREDRYFRIILSSNEGWAVPAELDDRRFFVLNVTHPLRDSEKEKNDYFDVLTDWADNGGHQYLLHHLLTRDISRFNHRLRPQTAALVDQQLATLNKPQKVVYVGLFNGTLTAHKVDGRRIFVATRLLREGHDLRIEHETSLGRELRKADGNSKQETVDGKKVRGYWLPPLPEARASWARANGLRINWRDDPDTWEGVDDDDEGKEVPF